MMVGTATMRGTARASLARMAPARGSSVGYRNGLPAILALALAFAVATPADTVAQEAGAAPTGQITARGTGRVAAVPDMAEVSLGVVREAANASEALRATSAAASEVLATMADLGIEPRDVQTSDVSLNPVYDQRQGDEPGAPVITGYRARNALTVRVRDLALLGEVIDRSVAIGANEGGGLRLTVSNADELEDEARADAVRNAREKAEAMARAAGIELGPLLSLDEDGGPSPVPQMAMRMQMAEAVPIAAGESDVTASVTAIYAIASRKGTQDGMQDEAE